MHGPAAEPTSSFVRWLIPSGEDNRGDAWRYVFFNSVFTFPDGGRHGEGVIWDKLRSAVDFATHVPRYREILRVLFKYGFADVLKLVVLQRLLGSEEKSVPTTVGADVLANPIPVRLRLALGELGPTFIKFGQMLSSRRDLITDDYYEELCKLQDSVPPFSTQKARVIVEKELGEPIENLFSEFGNKPVAGASIAQVYRANLIDGTEVAVKVQRPDIAKIVERDSEILLDFAGFLERHVVEIAGLNPRGIVQEFIASLHKEMDFQNEASNAERFREQFDGNPHILVPQVYWKMTTSKVLVMDFLTGVRVDHIEQLRKADIDPVLLSENITRLIYEMVFIHGFFHGDPHPGNMTILEDGVVGLYDYGMMGSFSPTLRECIATLILGLVEKEHRLTLRAILGMSEEGITNHPEKMLAEVESFSEEHLSRPLRELNLAHILSKLLELLRKNQLRMQSAFYMGIKALSQVQSIGTMLNPELNFVLFGEPYAVKILRNRLGPIEIWKLLRRLANESVDFLRQFPYDFRTFYETFKRGKFSLPLEHKIDPQGFEPLRKTLDSIANRLTNAILTASVLICSSIVTLAHVPPLLHGVSLPGTAGLCFGVYMCLRLLLSIWHHGGL